MKLLLIIALLTYVRGSALPDFCNVGAASGDGNNAITRYYYNAAQDACVTFRYTGSGGNGNNFLCEAECRRSCGLPPQSLCFLDAHPGQGNDGITRYYYNPTQKACLTFVYGGRGGNRNNFPHEAECRRMCGLPLPDACRVDFDQGSGTDWKTRFYYDREKNQCARFRYMGSGGNENSFVDEAECRRRCGLPPQHVCNQIMDAGTCNRKRTRFFNNIASNECESFTYNGCEGNDNRFVSLEACQGTCKVKSGFCRAYSDSGEGDDSITRYYYDMKKKACFSFVFKGKGGNRNNFANEAECRSSCWLPPPNFCRENADSGEGDDSITRYYYDMKQNACLSFVFKGKGGNRNNFADKAECSSSCWLPSPEK